MLDLSGLSHGLRVRELQKAILLDDKKWAAFVLNQPELFSELLEIGDEHAIWIAAHRAWVLQRNHWGLPDGVRPGQLVTIIGILRSHVRPHP